MNAVERVRARYAHCYSGTDSPNEELPPLPPDLERRILAMGQRWGFSGDEVADVLIRARRNPAGWTPAVAVDERREQEFRERGLVRADA